MPAAAGKQCWKVANVDAEKHFFTTPMVAITKGDNERAEKLAEVAYTVTRSYVTI